MSTYLIVHRPGTGVLDAPFHAQLAAGQTVGGFDAEGVRVGFERGGIGLEGQDRALAVVAEYREVHVAGESVLREAVGLVAYPVPAVPDLAHDGE